MATASGSASLYQTPVIIWPSVTAVVFIPAVIPVDRW